MLSPLHLRMARAALGWTFVGFSERTGIAKNSLMRFEQGGGINLSTATRIGVALTQEGVTLLYEDATHGPGVMISKELAHRLLNPNQSPPKAAKKAAKKPAAKTKPPRKR